MVLARRRHPRRRARPARRRHRPDLGRALVAGRRARGRARPVQGDAQRYGETLAATHDLNALVGAVLDTAVQATRARGGRLLLYDPERGEAIEQARIGTARGSRTDLPMVVAAGIGLEGEALSAHEPRVVQAPRAMLAVPILREHQLLGLVTTVDPEDGGFGDDDIESLSALAVQAGVAIENARLHRVVERQAVTDALTGPREPAPVLRGARAGVRALAAVRDAALADPPRHRRLQADQRHSPATSPATPCCTGRHDARRADPRDRPGGAVRRRGVRDPPAADRPGRRGPAGRAAPARDRLHGRYGSAPTRSRASRPASVWPRAPRTR